MTSSSAPAPKGGKYNKETKKRFQELAQCRECGTTLSNHTSRCPSCGRLRIVWWKWILGVSMWLLAGLVALYFVLNF